MVSGSDNVISNKTLNGHNSNDVQLMDGDLKDYDWHKNIRYREMLEIIEANAHTHRLWA